MLRQVVTALLHDGCTEVWADLPGYRAPALQLNDLADGTASDVIAHKDGLLLFAVETRDTIGTPYTLQKWRCLSSYASRSGALFCIVIPAGSLRRTEGILKSNGIEAELLQI